MSGYKQWADGDVLLPSEIDEYLVGQTIMRFANATARTAQLPSPAEGMRSYLADTGLDYIYKGSAWTASRQFLKKAAAQSVTSSATVVDDTDLQTTLVPGTFRIEAFLHASGAAAGDIKTTWTFAGTASDSSRSCFGPGVNTTNVEAAVTAATTVGVNRSSTHFITTEVSYGVDGTNTSAIHEDLYLVISAGGILKLRWAQNTSNGTASTLSVASRLYVSRLA